MDRWLSWEREYGGIANSVSYKKKRTLLEKQVSLAPFLGNGLEVYKVICGIMLSTVILTLAFPKCS